MTTSPTIVMPLNLRVGQRRNVVPGSTIVGNRAHTSVAAQRVNADTGYATGFDSTYGQFISIPSSGQIGATSYTVALAVKPGAIGTSINICNKAEFRILILNTGKVQFLVFWSDATNATILSNETLVANTWYYIICEIDRVNGLITIQINGNTRKTQAITIKTPVTGATPMTLGGNANFNGAMKNLHLWPTELLGSIDKASFFAGKCWPFDDFSIEMLDPPLYHVTPSINGSANVDIVGTYSGSGFSGSPTSIVGGAIRKWRGDTSTPWTGDTSTPWTGTATTPWSTFTANKANGRFTASVPMSNGECSLCTWFSDNPSISHSVSRIGVGVVVKIFGQSNLNGQGTLPETFTGDIPCAVFNAKHLHDDLTVDPVVAAYISGQEDTALGYNPTTNGSIWPAFCDAATADIGIPIELVIMAKNNTKLAVWQPGANPLDRTTLLGGWLSKCMDSSEVDTMPLCMYMGQTDAIEETDLTLLRTQLNNIAAAVFATTGQPLGVFLMENFATYSAQYTAVNNVYLAAANERDDVVIAADLRGLTTSGTAHWLTHAEVALAGQTAWDSGNGYGIKYLVSM